MKEFELTENIGDTEAVFRVLSGTALLGLTLLGYAPLFYNIIFPMMGAYFILTAIMKWDPIEYGIQLVFRASSRLAFKLSGRGRVQGIKPV